MAALSEAPEIYPLIRTKLNKPRLTADLVQRSHLIDNLNRGLARKLTLVTGRAGFGKTTLVLSWL